MKNNKHDHSLTKCLKGLVFALLILMPFLMFLPVGLYYGFNDGATVEGSIATNMTQAWTTVWNSTLFSWVQDTAIYTVLNTTTTAIEISSDSCLADYLTYIFLFTVIYVIVDIILGVFTALTHIFNKESK